MRIQHNIPAMSAYRNYTNNISAMKKNLEKLSSGYKINRAGDDAAGLAISEKMRAQITGLETAQKNAKDGISLVQTAEGALTEVHDMLNRMVELATQSANGTYDDTTDRDQLQKEMDQLRSEINRIADSANFNGIKLLDGSMDAGRVITTTADSAISEITTGEYAPKSASDAFESTFVTNRPEAATSQTCASFVVSLDDYKVTGAGTGDVFTLDVGGTEIKFALTQGNQDIDDIITGLLQGGHSTGDIPDATDGDATADATTSNMTSDFTSKTEWTTAANTGAYVEIDGHIWKMTQATAAEGAVGGRGIKFTQVDFGSENVNPDYQVSFSGAESNASTGVTLNVTGMLNPQVQVTTKGTAVGSTHQARVDTTIDFSKLKDGDTFTVGGKNFIFAVGKDSTYKTATTAPGSNATYTAVDLSGIFKEESDLLDATKQADAMVKITEVMVGSAASATSGTWTVGNQGVSGNKGTLTFQSLSSYNGENTTVTNDDVYIGGITANGVCDMRTEASVMKQFYSGRQESGAKLSFDIDVTKIKAGQTFTIDGKTFEFVDGEGNGSKGNVEIDLSDEGIAAGILNSQTATVMEKIKSVLGADGTATPPGSLLQSDGTTAKYKVTYDGNRLTLSTQDDNRTSAFENRVSAKITLPTETTTGKGLSLQIGDTSESFNQLKVNIKDCHTTGMGIDKISIADQSSAQSAVSVIKDAINYVSDVRGTLGATQNRLDHTINNLAVMTENIQDAESTIRDVDVAEEMMAYTKNNILIQSAQAMLAQANQMPQGVLQLLQ